MAEVVYTECRRKFGQEIDFRARQGGNLILVSYNHVILDSVNCFDYEYGMSELQTEEYFHNEVEDYMSRLTEHDALAFAKQASCVRNSNRSPV